MGNNLNAIEYLQAVARWYDYQDANLSFNLKSPEDAIKLYRAWTSSEDLPEFCDCAESPEEARLFASIRKAVLGYDPLG